MSELFDRLEGRERKTLERLAAAALLAVVLYVLLAMGQRTRYFGSQNALTELQANARRSEKSHAEAKAEWARWQDALRDLDSFRGSYFYKEKTLYQSLRTDLQQIFRQAGMDIPQIGYRYSDLEKVALKKVLITFNYSGSYADLKKFLAIVERFPKFLDVEKVDFQKTDSSSGLLNLKLTLAGYYEI